MSTRIHTVLIGTAAFTLSALTQLAVAQTAAETIGGAMPAATQDAPYASPGVSDATNSSGSSATSGASASSGASAPDRPRTITVISGPFAEGSSDPFVQRREAKAQAEREYEQQQEALRREYEQEKRQADAEFRRSMR